MNTPGKGILRIFQKFPSGREGKAVGLNGPKQVQRPDSSLRSKLYSTKLVGRGEDTRGHWVIGGGQRRVVGGPRKDQTIPLAGVQKDGRMKKVIGRAFLLCQTNN